MGELYVWARWTPALAGVTVLVALFFLSCSKQGPVAGGSTETTDGFAITGLVVDEEDQEVANAEITLVPDGFNPVTSSLPDTFSITADDNGHYTFAGLDSGIYNVQVHDPVTEKRAFIPGVTPALDTTTAPLGVITQPGNITVRLTPNITEGTLYLIGTDKTVPVTATELESGTVTIEALAPGNYGVEFYNPQISNSITVSSDALVFEAATIIVGTRSDWQVRQKIGLNTSSSGADVFEDLPAFPLLVKLTGDNFNFRGADAQGEDIRFTGSNDQEYPFEIESWDAVAEEAVIWVLLDTLKGNSTTQSLLLYSGNISATLPDYAGVVFATTNGYQGVWHMHNDPTDSADVLVDATSNAYHMSAFGSMTSDALVEGAAGSAMEFDGVDDHFELGPGTNMLRNVSAFTLSAWFKVDTLDLDSVLFMDFFSAGYGDTVPNAVITPFSRAEFGVELDFLHMIGFGTTPGSSLKSSPGLLQTDTWFYAAALVDFPADSVAIYLNGNLVLSRVGNGGSQATLDTSPFNVVIGAEDGGLTHFMDGILDEVRVSDVARSPAWIKACYENQRVGSSLVTVE